MTDSNSIFRSNKYDFIALVHSSWHLDSLSTWLYGNKLVGLVLIMPQSNIGDGNFFRLQVEDVKSIDLMKESTVVKYDSHFCSSKFRFITSLLSRVVQKPEPNKSVFLLSAMDVNLSLLANIHFSFRVDYIVLDEGNGSYFPFKEFSYRKSALKFGPNDIRTYIYTYRSVIVKFVKDLALNFMGVEVKKWDFFEVKGDINELKVNQAFCIALKNILSRRVLLKKAAISTHLIADSAIVFVDFNVVDERVMAGLIEKIILEIRCHDETLNIYIKPHPNSEIHKYIPILSGVLIVDESINGEELAIMLKPKIIFGGWSSITYHLPYLVNAPIIAFCPLYLKMFSLKSYNKVFINQLTEKMSFLPNLYTVDRIEKIQSLLTLKL